MVQVHDVVYNKVKELSTMPQGTQIILKVVITEAKQMVKKDQVSPYLQLFAQDSSGNVDFPVWDNYEQRVVSLVPGRVIGITGVLNFYEGKPQIKDPVFHPFPGADPKECVPKYDIPVDLLTYFVDIVSNMEDKYKRFAISATGCMGDSKSKWDLFTQAPAAKGHHHHKIGGLFLHTIGLMKNIESILNLYVVNPFFANAGNVINKDRIMLKAILHDIGKVWEYEWDTGIKRKKIVRDHIMMGVSYIERLNEQMHCFDDVELDNICASIMTHHGDYENCQYGHAEMKTPEDYMLHLADMIDSKIVGAAESTKTP